MHGATIKIFLHFGARQGVGEQGNYGSLCDREELLFSKGSERL